MIIIFGVFCRTRILLPLFIPSPRRSLHRVTSLAQPRRKRAELAWHSRSGSSWLLGTRALDLSHSVAAQPAGLLPLLGARTGCAGLQRCLAEPDFPGACLNMNPASCQIAGGNSRALLWLSFFPVHGCAQRQCMRHSSSGSCWLSHAYDLSSWHAERVGWQVNKLPGM